MPVGRAVSKPEMLHLTETEFSWPEGCAQIPGVEAPQARAAAADPRAARRGDASITMEEDRIEDIGLGSRADRDLILSTPQGAKRQPCATAIVPGGVKRAIEFMHANLGGDVTIADLAAVANVASRTLFKHFRDFTGVSPMRYLRERRLDRVREELERSADASVSDVAMRCGFAHLGRFAAAYRSRFGESPSATARRGSRLPLPE
jgi:AraC-like DNA-binding protein